LEASREDLLAKEKAECTFAPVLYTKKAAQEYWSKRGAERMNKAASKIDWAAIEKPHSVSLRHLDEVRWKAEGGSSVDAASSITNDSDLQESITMKSFDAEDNTSPLHDTSRISEQMSYAVMFDNRRRASSKTGASIRGASILSSTRNSFANENIDDASALSPDPFLGV